MTKVAEKHVLAIAYPASGHTIPLLQLARKLSKHHHVTYAVSKFVANRMRHQEFASLATDEPISLFAIDDGVPEGTHFKVEEWDKAHAMLFNHVHPGVKNLMANVTELNVTGKDIGLKRKVDVVIFDMFLAPSVMAGRIPGVLYYYFNSPPAYFMRYLLKLVHVTETCESDVSNVPNWFQSLPPPGENLPPQPQLILEEMGPLGKYLPQVDGVVCNSYREIDKEDIEILEKEGLMNNVKFFCLGPFIAAPVSSGDETEVAVLKWLNKQKPQSVVYISFGSMAVPPEPQLKEIADALVRLKVPFIWSLRKGHELQLPGDVREMIVRQLENPNIPFWIIPWAPQNAILNHPATGAYMSHCGWNSALESMSAGVPIVAWPLFADQQTIGQVLVKRGAAVMINGTSFLFRRIVTSEEIQEAISMILTDTMYREGMQRMQEDIKDAVSETGSSMREFDKFVHFDS